MNSVTVVRLFLAMDSMLTLCLSEGKSELLKKKKKKQNWRIFFFFVMKVKFVISWYLQSLFSEVLDLNFIEQIFVFKTSLSDQFLCKFEFFCKDKRHMLLRFEKDQDRY